MSKRFFTADLHFGSTVMVDEKLRPFKTVERMNEALIRNINQRCKEDDILISVGDVAQYGDDREWKGEKIKPNTFINRLNPTFLNIEGNHDPHNRVKSVCNSMRITLGRFKAVSIGHYPSYDPRSKGSFHKGDVRLCGHVHNAWKYFIDEKNYVLNINVGVDQWKYMPISETELIDYITMIMKNVK